MVGRSAGAGLSDGQKLTRDELGDVLQRAGIAAKGLRLAYIVMCAELDAIICSGARRGKQFTYAFLDERASHAKTLEYVIAYRDHGGVFDPANLNKLIFGHIIVIDGRVIDTWRRMLKKDAVVIETNTFERLTKAESRAVGEAARQYAAFLGLPVEMV